MTVARIAISLDADLARELRKSIKKGEALSAWLADAERRKLRSEGLMRVVSAWEAEHGDLTQAELELAARARKGEPARRAQPSTKQPRSPGRARRKRQKQRLTP